MPDVFSSTVVTVHDPDPPYKWIPEMLDPPGAHRRGASCWRPISPRAMERLEDRVQGALHRADRRVAGTGHCDFLRDFAWRYPTTIFMELMGLPLDGLEQFLAWEHQILHPAVGTTRSGREPSTP